MLEDISASIGVAAAPERVWTAMTEERAVADWLGCLGYRARPGSVFYMQPDEKRRRKGDTAGATPCELLSLERPERMAFSWLLPGAPKTLVELIVTPGGPGTRVSLLHSGWDQFGADLSPVRDQLESGWRDTVLPALKRAAEG